MYWVPTCGRLFFQSLIIYDMTEMTHTKYVAWPNSMVYFFLLDYFNKHEW